MTDLPRHSVSVAGVVFDQHDRVLAIRRRDNGQWQPPGGVLELDETFEDGVCREVLEETGVHVQVERLTGVYKHMKMSVVALVFRCVPTGGAPHASDESHEARWLALPVALRSMPPIFAIRVEDALLSTIRTRTHDGVIVLE